MWPLLCAAVVSGFLFTGSTPTAGLARSGPGLASQAQALHRSESSAVLQLYAAEAALARAQTEQARLESRSAALARAEAEARLETGIVRRSLDASQRRVAVLLRNLYIQGEPDPLAVILGATSLDEVMAGIDGLARATAQNERLATEAMQRASRLERLRTNLASRRESLNSARAEASAGTRRLASAVAGQRQTVASIRRRTALTEQRLTALEAQAHEAQVRSAGLTQASTESAATSAPAATAAPVATTTPATPAAPATPATGTHTLVVDAVAYHLPGNTASGLPVGIGVIAVDPTVIPLGTRVFVPGYGPAVAADVGSAVKGNIIDLWMPSTAQARAWGRRTVTITIYG